MDGVRTLTAAPVRREKPARGFWRLRFVDPLVVLLKQGTTPEMLARTFAVGSVCSLFPFLGTTSVLNLLVGLWHKLNQPVLQTLNQLLGPLQLVMIFVYVRIGEWLWQDAEHRFSVREMIDVFRNVRFTEFLAQFGWAGVHAFTAWALTAPFLFAAVYFAVRPAMMKLAGGTGSEGDER